MVFHDNNVLFFVEGLRKFVCDNMQDQMQGLAEYLIDRGSNSVVVENFEKFTNMSEQKQALAEKLIDKAQERAVARNLEKFLE